MTDRRHQLLSQLRNNLAIASRAVGLDQSKASSVERQMGGHARDGSPFDLHQSSIGDVDMRHSGYHQPPRRMMTETFSTGYAPENGSGSNYHHDEMLQLQQQQQQQQRSMFGGGERFAVERMNAERMNAEQQVRHSAADVESEDRFLYGAEPDGEARNPMTHNKARPAATIQDDLLDKINFLFHGKELGKKQHQPESELESGDRARSNLFPIVFDYPTSSYGGGAYGADQTKPRLPSPKPPSPPVHPAGNDTRDETIDKILRTIGMDDRLSDLVQDLLRKETGAANERPFDTGAMHRRPQDTSATNRRSPAATSAQSSTNQIRNVGSQNSTHKNDWNEETERFLLRITGSDTRPRSMEESPPPPPPPPPLPPTPPLPRPAPSMSLLRYPETADESSARRWRSDMESADSPRNVENRLYFKPQQQEAPLSAPPPKAMTSSAEFNLKDLDPLMQALDESLSNIKVLEEALVSLEKSKRSMMIRPPDSQRDALMLENMRMQEEIEVQLIALKETARVVSEKIRDQMFGSTFQRAAELRAEQESKPTQRFPTSMEESSVRETSPPRDSRRIRVSTVAKKSRSRSPMTTTTTTSRDYKRDRSKSRSQSPKRNRSRRRDRSRHRYSGSRGRSRSRSRSRGDRRRDSRSRSRDRNRRRHNRSSSGDRRGRSRDRNSSRVGYGKEASRKTSDGGKRRSSPPPPPLPPPPLTAEEKEKKALEMMLSIYLRAEEFYLGTNIWCQKCDSVFTDVFGLCRHLHSETHQTKIDPDFTKPRPPLAPVIPAGVASAPARGYEFVLPLQAFFCSLCCEFSKDIGSAEEHVKTIEHNNKFKQFLKENSGYELKFLKDMTTAIAKSKGQSSDVIVVDDALDDEKTKNAKKGFQNLENDSKSAMREKFKIEFTGTLKQNSAAKVAPAVAPALPAPASKSQKGVQPTRAVKTEANVAVTTTKVATTKVTTLLAPTVTKLTGVKNLPLPKNSGKAAKDYSELVKHTGWVLKANAAAVATFPPKKLPASIDMFSSEPPSLRPQTFLSKLQPKMPTLMTGKMAGAKAKTSNVNTTGSAKKVEEALVNINDFEIFDEC